MSLLRSARLTCQKESSVTKEQIDALLKLLDKPGVGMNDGDAVHKLQSTHGSVISVPLCLTILILSSALERIKDMLREASSRVENAGYFGTDDGKDVFELLAEIQAAVGDCQVSSKTGSAV